jgi:hypothetical protein
MRELQWSEIDACPTCFALVPSQVMDGHESWHDRIAAEAIRSSKRLDQLSGVDPALERTRRVRTPC